MQRDWIVRSESISDMESGCYPGSRPLEDHLRNGIVIIDKPSGPSSHQVAGWVRDMLDLEKAGHAGTLDPKVTGVLVLALQNATKVMPALQGADKEYVGVMTLHSDISMERLEDILEDFRGVIEQKPPRKSAVKRETRERTINSLEALEKDGRNVLFRVDCEAGTYIRKLVADIGEELDGAHMAELRRTRAGHFTESEAVTLHDLKDAFILWADGGDEDTLREIVLPVERGVEKIRKVVIKDTAVDAVCNGAPLSSGGITRLEKGIEKGDLTAILSLKGELVALGKAAASSEEMNNKNTLAVNTDRVLMDRGTYPSTWKDQ